MSNIVANTNSTTVRLHNLLHNGQTRTAREGSTWCNRSKIQASASGGMPGPESAIEIPISTPALTVERHLPIRGRKFQGIVWQLGKDLCQPIPIPRQSRQILGIFVCRMPAFVAPVG
jgi:hypothetical protein